MGSISRFSLNRIAKEYDISYFVETGTWKGDGVAYALKAPFKRIISIEIVPGIAKTAKERFKPDQKVEIIEGDSVAVLARELAGLNGNCLFWLDAHFPGADEGVKKYDAEEDEDLRLPLEKEIVVIKNTRPTYNDVLIIDDLRIYEDGPYENDNAPADTLPKGNRSIDFIFKQFESSHIILKSYLDEGYLLLFPKESYLKKHRTETDFYLVSKAPQKL